ncbi:MAG: FtsX-like permease family protein, partial [Longimicrobiales bacterium]
TQEIGIRMALGARETDVLRMVLVHAARLVALGIALGVIAAFALSSTLASLLYNLSPTDPMTFAIIAIILSIVALIATVLPAMRAARVDPVVALRQE